MDGRLREIVDSGFKSLKKLIFWKGYFLNVASRPTFSHFIQGQFGPAEPSGRFASLPFNA
jgi:hypothetical protein